MTLEQHVWLHPKTANADFAAQEAQSGRRSRRDAAAAQFLHSGGRSIDRGGNPPGVMEANNALMMKMDAKRRDSAGYKAQLAPDER